jgi:hypothetical protein
MTTPAGCRRETASDGGRRDGWSSRPQLLAAAKQRLQPAFLLNRSRSTIQTKEIVYEKVYSLRCRDSDRHDSSRRSSIAKSAAHRTWGMVFPAARLCSGTLRAVVREESK